MFRAFITVFNRLTCTKNLAENLADVGCEVILVDNNSTYQPLLEWYKTCPFKIHYLKENYLSVSLWESGLINTYNDRYYLSTDPDLDISNVPKDFIDILFNGLEKSDKWKAGLSLEIDDLPKNEYTKKVIEHESHFWKEVTDFGFYKADVGGTLALYDRNKSHDNFLDAIRSPKPYTARHLDWYSTKETLTNEDLYYLETSKWYGWMQYLMK